MSRNLLRRLLWFVLLLGHFRFIQATTASNGINDEQEDQQLAASRPRSEIAETAEAYENGHSYFSDALDRGVEDAHQNTLYSAAEATAAGCDVTDSYVRDTDNITQPCNATLAELIGLNSTNGFQPTFGSSATTERGADSFRREQQSENMIFKVNVNEEKDDDGGRQYLYGTRNPLFAVGTGLLLAYETTTSRKRKKPSACTSSDTSPAKGTAILKQPDSEAISKEQLIAKVKAKYAALVMVESKCIEVDNAQWQDLIALHRVLLHEHRDFFLATQHASVSPAMRRLAMRCNRLARMWRHGIISNLELLRHRLPMSLDCMVKFIYLVYAMTAVLYEEMPALEDVWIECLGDLGRYRIAIEDDKFEERSTWTSVSRHWYTKAMLAAPTTGRLYHHLAILARPNALLQLFYYNKSLTVPIPFDSARESILTLFEPLDSLAMPSQTSRLQPADFWFIRAHSAMFRRSENDLTEQCINKFLTLLDSHIDDRALAWMAEGYLIAISNSNALLGYGDKSNPFMSVRKIQEIVEGRSSLAEDGIDPNSFADLMRCWDRDAPSHLAFRHALDLESKVDETVLRRLGDPSILPYLHTRLVFMSHLAENPTAMAELGPKFPWELLAQHLNRLISLRLDLDGGYVDPFAGSPDNETLPEDVAMRGLVWCLNYFPSDWFATSSGPGDIEDTMHPVVRPSTHREDRIIYLGHKLAKNTAYLSYDNSRLFFTPSPAPVSDGIDIEMNCLDLELEPHWILESTMDIDIDSGGPSSVIPHGEAVHSFDHISTMSPAELDTQSSSLLATFTEGAADVLEYEAVQSGFWSASLNATSSDDSPAQPTPISDTDDSAAAEGRHPQAMSCLVENCSHRFDRKCDLNKHVASHTKPIVCELCSHRCASRRDLQRHKIAQHGEKKLEFPCDQCSPAKVFGRKDHLKRHLDTIHQHNSSNH